jgi:hypothetical protein
MLAVQRRILGTLQFRAKTRERFTRNSKMESHTTSPTGANKSNGSDNSDCRMPAVIGVLPWSWKGDTNNGNMIHAAAARRMISRYVEYERPGEWTDAEIDHLRSENSHIVFVTANLIRLGVPSEHPSIRELIASQVAVAKNIQRAGLPVVVFGLGSQAGLKGSSEFSVAPETVRLLNIISDHSRKIAVRGAFTAETCARLGIKNVEVVGCQSMFWHRSPQFDWGLSEPIAGAPDKIAFNFTYGPAEANLINQAMVNGYDIIGQGNMAEEELKSQKAGAPELPAAKFGWEVGVALDKGLIDRRKYEL